MVANELKIMKIELSPESRMRLSESIRSRMEEMGIVAYDYKKLKLGFDLPITWPADKDCEIEMFQLATVAFRLELNLIINDNGIWLRPFRNED